MEIDSTNLKQKCEKFDAENATSMGKLPCPERENAFVLRSRSLNTII